jgi:molybdate transport system ATP-binding protein
MIQFESVNIQKGERIVLENINWAVKKGQNWAIIGGNGAGKSTLLDVIMGKSFPSKGKITTLPHTDIVLVPKDYSFNRIVAAATQYYQQRFNAFDAEIAPTVREILQNRLKPIGTINANSVILAPPLYTDEIIEEAANLLKINHLLDQPIVTLSNGETRRTLLTLSLLKKPKVLLLDNPFIGLDVASRKTLHDILDQLAAKGIQIILVTSAKEIPMCVQRILEVEDGKIKQIHTLPFDFQQVTNAKKQTLHPDILSKIKEKSVQENFKFAINMRHITVTYNGVNVVNNVNWQVKRGEKWALMGANGSGKSTLLSLITADNPQGYHNDYDLFDKKRGSGESIWDIKQRIGYVSPELHLYFNHHTEVWRAVASGFFDSAGLFRTVSDAQKTTIDLYLQLLNIQHLANRKVFQLSSGEQRQVFLARALVKNPSLLLLDEPCQGLDYDHIVYFRDLVNDLVVALDKTLVYVTHYEEEIPACVDKRLVLSKGKVV